LRLFNAAIERMVFYNDISRLLAIKPRPNRAVIRWPFHPANIVIDTYIHTALLLRGGRQHQVDAQAAARVVFKTLAAVIKPAVDASVLWRALAKGIFKAPGK